MLGPLLLLFFCGSVHSNAASDIAPAQSMMLLVNSSQLTASAPRPVPPLPEWALEYRMDWESEGRQDSWQYNLAVVERSNASRQRLDFALFGDSMTARIITHHPELWQEYWGDLDAAPLGVGGNTVQELAWRLGAGGERFALGPRVVAFWIGYNNLAQFDDPGPRVAFLLGWARASWPSSHIMLLNILPNTNPAIPPALVEEVNTRYRMLAARWGASFSTCGSRIDPWDTSLLKDGKHPAEAGYRRIFYCLRHQRESLMAADAGRQ